MTAPTLLPSMPLEGPPKKIFEALPFLDVTHPIWEANWPLWDKEEQRLYGSHVVLQKDLVVFDWEQTDGPHYKYRQRQAHYVNLPKVHAELITGHVGKKRPTPGAGLNFGSLGDVRGREAQVGLPTRAELLYYNTDGIGQDALEWAQWWDGVYRRAEATGHRWVLVESPRINPTLRETLTFASEMSGARPYLVEYSPIRVPNWWYHNGELEFAVLRPTVDEPYLQTGTLYMPQLRQRGWYLLVRRGCTILGDDFADGGWWLWDSQRRFIDAGDWTDTDGRIPLFVVFSQADPGTNEHFAMSVSQTSELGQCAVGLMNLTSARDWDAFNAAQSKTYVLGADPSVMQVIIDKAQDSQIIPVPPVNKEDGTVLVPTLYDGSQGAVAAQVFDQIVNAKFNEAKQTMMEKVTSSQNASGAKQAASFAEASSPLLVSRARAHQQAETTALNFLEMRWGTLPPGARPTSYAIYPDDYELAPLIDDIDAEFDTLRRAEAIVPGAGSDPQLVVDLVIQSLNERGVMPKTMTEEELRVRLLTSIAHEMAVQDQQNAANAMKLGLNPLTREVPSGAVPPMTLPALGTGAPGSQNGAQQNGGQPAGPPDRASAPKPANPPTQTPKGAPRPRTAQLR